jgi:predicted transcriptional regulator YdeE
VIAVMNAVTGLFAHRVEGTEPRIVELEVPIQIVGLSVQTDTKRVYRDVSRLGRQLEAYKQGHDIPNTVEPWSFAAVSSGFDPEPGSFTYSMGDVVSSLDEVPSDLAGLEIPAGTYAVFPVRPKNRLGWGFAIGHVKRYAYSTWLPRSGYEPARTIDDFEYHDERSKRKKDPEIDLYVALKPRNQHR